MRILGRLAMAAALLIPAGVVVAQTTAHAAGGGFNCTGGGGTATFSPGLLLSTGRPQTVSVHQSGLTCTGGFVTGGSLSASMQTPSVRCSGMVGSTASGSGTATWTDAGMGKSTMKFNMKVTGSTGHTTTGTISGLVTTSGSNLASGKTISGTFTLGKGLKSTNSGGDCTVTIPLSNFGLTAIAFHTN